MDTSLTIRLDESVARELDAESERTHRSKGEIVREALLQHLRRDRASALEAASPYVGCVDGPADLSTDKKYLADLGRRRR